jgi:glycosyltransferase involved in cell wall biosynthesis
LHFSIIIPVFNSSNTIESTINSILNQNFISYEILIMDACSTDSTINIIRNINNPNIKIHTKKDNGPYDAMNTGIDLAKGIWVLFLGSDDLLYDNYVLYDVFKLTKSTNKDVIYGDAKISGNVSWAKGNTIYGGKFSLYQLLRRNICHQAIFYRRTFLLKNHLRYKLIYSVSADWDFNLRAWLIKPFQYYPRIISIFCAGGISSGGKEDGFKHEIPKLYKQYFNIPYTNPISRFIMSIGNNLFK